MVTIDLGIGMKFEEERKVRFFKGSDAKTFGLQNYLGQVSAFRKKAARNAAENTFLICIGFRSV